MYVKNEIKRDMHIKNEIKIMYVKNEINSLFINKYLIIYLYFYFRLLFSFSLSNRPTFQLWSFLYDRFLPCQNPYRLGFLQLVSFAFNFWQPCFHIINRQLIIMSWLVCLHFTARLEQSRLAFLSSRLTNKRFTSGQAGQHLTVYFLLSLYVPDFHLWDWLV